MSEVDIAKEYREAANKRKQIGVLADLNECTRKQIQELLIKNGEEISEEKTGFERNARRRVARDQQIVAMHESGTRVVEIAAIFGLSRQAVYRTLDKAKERAEKRPENE